MYNDPHRYDDMLELAHPTPRCRPRMSALSRAAQFSPFAALTGYDGQIRAAHHRRCNPISLSDEEQAPINALLSTLKKHDRVSITYFFPDPGTDGSGGTAEGEYRSVSGEVQYIAPAYRSLRLGGANWWVDIPFADIIAIHRTA